MKYIAYIFTAQLSEAEDTLELEIIYDLLAASLGEIGFDSFEVESGTLKAYIPSDLENREQVDECLSSMPFDRVRYTYTTEPLPDVNWNEEWEKNYFQPIVLGDSLCVIRAPFHTNYPEARTEVIIQPKMAFGTGNHETTALIISYLLEHDIDGSRVLDMGAGSGILGILALKQGAESLTAIDIDEWAYLNILENATLNGVTVDCAIQGDASTLAGKGPFDLILANITRNVLLEDMPHYISVMAPRGRIVFSGFYEEDMAILVKRGEELGLIYSSHQVKNRWMLLEMELA